MNENILYISDFSAAELNGAGAEAYDSVLIKELGCDFTKSFFVDSLTEYDKIVVSNFFQLQDEMKKKIMDHGNYVIISHDFLIFKNRVPNTYPDYLCPRGELVNVEFFERAKANVVQSQVQMDIFKKNLDLKNLWCLHGNIWSEEELDVFLQANIKKNGRCCLLSSPYATKGGEQAVNVAQQLQLPFDILPVMENKEFIQTVGKYSAILLFPQITESFGRVACEARMMNVLPITNFNMSCAAEEFYQFSANKIGQYMNQRREELINFIKMV